MPVAAAVQKGAANRDGTAAEVGICCEKTMGCAALWICRIIKGTASSELSGPTSAATGSTATEDQKSKAMDSLRREASSSKEFDKLTSLIHNMVRRTCYTLRRSLLQIKLDELRQVFAVKALMISTRAKKVWKNERKERIPCFCFGMNWLWGKGICCREEIQNDLVDRVY